MSLPRAAIRFAIATPIVALAVGVVAGADRQVDDHPIRRSGGFPTMCAEVLLPESGVSFTRAWPADPIGAWTLDHDGGVVGYSLTEDVATAFLHPEDPERC